MSPLSWAALTVGIVAVLALGINLPDPWFLALLSLACMLGAADAAYRELTVWAVVFLTSGLLLAVGALRTALRDTDRDGT
ncbi:hypothetical protein [Streptomyces bullii]|uniref:Uncharacterized protein n=1 Tax=Streptomyces bullii TaxID=349910 RepID=A0ABW0USE6_9ACTN